MAKSNDKALDASMRKHRPREEVAAELDSTVFGQIAAEAKDARMIPIDKIVSSPYQSRSEPNQEYIEQLAQSINDSGQLVPIIVREKVSNLDTLYELVAGHNRVAASRFLGRMEVPALVRPMSDTHAARALTIENTNRSQLTDYELYKHLTMLRATNAVRNVTDTAAVLHVARTHIYKLEAFEALPDAVLPLLDKQPALIGGSLMASIAPLCITHPQHVIEAVQLLADGKLTQAGVVGWVKRRASPPDAPYRKEVSIKGGGKTVKLVITDGEAKVSGDLNFDRLHALIEANLAELIVPPKDE